VLGNHYICNGEKFDNYFASLKHYKHTGSFNEFVVPKEHLNAFESVDVKQATALGSIYWIKIKLEKIFSEYPRVRLHYSGGTDSHSLLHYIAENGHQLHSVFMYLTALENYEYVDEEQWPGYQYIINNSVPADKLEIFKPEIRHYEQWQDLYLPFNVPGFYFGIRPTWLSTTMEYCDTADIELGGQDKPHIYKKGDHYYWYYMDDDTDFIGTQHIDFFIDSTIPELAVAQVYSAKNFYQTYLPDQQGALSIAKVPFELRRLYHESLSRVPALNDKLEMATVLGKGPNPFNNKHVRLAEELVNLERSDILEAWNACRISLLADFKNFEHGLDTSATMQAPWLQNKTIQIPKPVNRLAFAYRLDDAEMIKVDPQELF